MNFVKGFLPVLGSLILSIVVVLCAIVAAEGADCSDLSEQCMTETLYSMSDKQLDNMQFAIRKGEDKEIDLSTTLAAICWQESDCGRDTVDREGAAYGMFQNSIRSVISRYENEFGELSDDDRHMMEHRLAWKLYNDRGYAVSQAIAEFQWWLKIYWGHLEPYGWRWRNALMSYNAGTKNRAGTGYFKAVNIKARVVRKHKAYIMGYKLRRKGE